MPMHYGYQVQQRRRDRQNGAGASATQQVTQAAQQARRGSSRQGAGNLNRARPGVPGIPVQGIDASFSAGDAPGGGTELDPASGRRVTGPKREPDTTKQEGGAPSGAGAGATTLGGLASGLPASIQNLQQAGALAGTGAGMRAGGMPSGIMGETLGPAPGALTTGLGGGGMEPGAIRPEAADALLPGADVEMPGVGVGQARRWSDPLRGGVGAVTRYGQPTKGDIHGQTRDPLTGEIKGLFDPLGQDRGVQEIVEDRGIDAAGTEGDQEEFDRLEEERAMYEEIYAGLEAEREESQGIIQRGISEQQRRQAEMNALAGRSVGGGFGGAMATTSAMGAAAMEEADRAIRDQMRQAQVGWLDTVTRLNEAERGREFERELTDEERAFQLEMGALQGTLDLPGDGAGGSQGGSAADWRADREGDEEDGATTAPGEAHGTGEEYDPENASGSATFREGWRPHPDGSWRNRDGEKWEDVYDTPPPENNSLQDYSSSMSSDQFANEEFGEEGQFWFNEFWEGRIGIEQLIQQMGPLLGDERNYTEDTIEQLADLLIDDDSTVFTDEAGNSLRGNDLQTILQNLADTGGWNDNELNFEGLSEREDTDEYSGKRRPGDAGELGIYSNTTVEDDQDKRLLWAMSQPGLMREIINQTLLYQQDNPNASVTSPDYASELMGWLEASGVLDPGRN